MEVLDMSMILLIAITIALTFNSINDSIRFRRTEKHLKYLDVMIEELKDSNMRISSIQDKQMEEYQDIAESLKAFGARWGLQTESSFRNGIKGILEEKGYDVGIFREKNDKDVFVEIDVVINSKDERPYLIEIKSSVDHHDIIRFDSFSKFFTEKTGKTPGRKSIISPYVQGLAYDAAEKYGVEIFTHSSDYK